MPRANRHYIPGYVGHITHRCHKKEFLLKFTRDRRRYLIQCLLYIDLNMVRAGVVRHPSDLMASYDQEGILLTKMAGILGMERTTLSRNLSLLERRGVVSIEPGGDRRERRIAIKKKGVELLGKALPLWERAQKEVI